MTKKEKLIAEAKAQGHQLTGEETVPQLEALFASSTSTDQARDGETLPEDEKNPTPKGMTKQVNGAAGPARRSNAAEEADFKRTANATKTMLDAEPKVRIYVPLELGEPKGTQLPVEINGYKWFVPKGVPNVEVPQPIADIIWQSLGIYDEASSALRSQNDPDRPLRLDLQDEADRRAVDA